MIPKAPQIQTPKCKSKVQHFPKRKNTNANTITARCFLPYNQIIQASLQADGGEEEEKQQDKRDKGGGSWSCTGYRSGGGSGGGGGNCPSTYSKTSKTSKTHVRRSKS